jgi:hypothetical protein
LSVVGDCLLERRADDGARDSKKRFAKNLDEKPKQEFDEAPIGERLTTLGVDGGSSLGANENDAERLESAPSHGRRGC